MTVPGLDGKPMVGAIVNGQRVGAAPVPWVFEPGGSVEAPGLWKGRWTLQPEGTLRVVMTFNGVTDDLVLRFEGGGFTATKNGQPYGWGQLLP